MVLKRLVLRQFHYIFGEGHIHRIGLGLPRRIFCSCLKQIGVGNDLFSLLLIRQGFQQLIRFQRLAIFRETAVIAGFSELFIGVFVRHSFQLRIPQRFAVFVQEAFCLCVILAESADLPDKRLCGVLITLVILIALGGVRVLVRLCKLALSGAVHPGGTVLIIVGNGAAEQLGDPAEHHHAAPLDKFFKKRDIRLIQQEVSEKIVLGVMRLRLVHIEEVQRIVRQQRVGAARLHLLAEIAHQRHDLPGFVLEFGHVLVQKFLIRHFFKMRIFHIQQRQIRDRVAGILRGLIAHINAHRFQHSAVRGRALIEVGGGEDIALCLAVAARLLLGFAVKHLHFAHISFSELSILFRFSKRNRPRLRAEQ